MHILISLSMPGLVFSGTVCAIRLKILALRWQVVCTVASMVPAEPSAHGLCLSGKKASLDGSTVKAVKDWTSSGGNQGLIGLDFFRGQPGMDV
jgi:hypothetical protein